MLQTSCLTSLLSSVASLNAVKNLDIVQIVPSNFLNLRMNVEGDECQEELVQSIRKHGLLQPLIVRRRSELSEEIFELVCGYRRYEACRKLMLKTVQCMVMEMNDREALEISLIENIQRQNLNPIEEAEAFRLYVVNFGRGGVTRLGQRIGKSEEYVSQRLLLLGLPKEIIDRISRRLLKVSHACELVWLKNTDEQMQLADKIRVENLTLRQVRILARQSKAKRAEDSSGNVGLQDSSANQSTYAIDDKPEVGSSSYEQLSSDARQRMAILDKTILLIRTSLAGIDMLIEKTQYEDIQQLLMDERFHMHTCLDQAIKVRMSHLRTNRDKIN